ncbi:MAG: EVE domain-containing protein [bacterium]|nr:EVE domain-containing protein [bacterium]
MKKYWLLKSEPGCYSILDWKRDGATMWDGVRNFQARNFIRDEMKKGDGVLFYHSSCAIPAVVGVGEVVSGSYPDPTQFNKKDRHFDAKSSKKDPIWYVVDVKFKQQLTEPVTLARVKDTRALDSMMLVKKGVRLSVQPLVQSHFEKILAMSL